ncbi:MAG: hypothetical protein IJG42_01500 [Muribaculaceae bacterium]|nr:hypothetical protein [Muribaculaceae bacterium]
MDHLTEILVPIACGCVLPIVAILSGVRKKMNETNQRTQIVLAAIEKNPEMDIEEIMKKMSRNGKLLKEKLLTKLLWGCLTTLLGIGLVGFGIYLSANHLGGTDDPMTAVCFGLASLGVGIAFLVNYFVGKKMLAKEMEAEEKRVTEQA